MKQVLENFLFLRLIKFFSRDPLVIATVIDDDKQGFTGVSKPKDLENLLTLFRLKLRSSPISDLALEKIST